MIVYGEDLSSYNLGASQTVSFFGLCYGMEHITSNHPCFMEDESDLSPCGCFDFSALFTRIKMMYISRFFRPTDAAWCCYALRRVGTLSIWLSWQYVSQQLLSRANCRAWSFTKTQQIKNGTDQTQSGDKSFIWSAADGTKHPTFPHWSTFYDTEGIHWKKIN